MNRDQFATLDQFASIITYSLLAVWYLAPWLRKLGRADALIVLLWFHIFRYVSPYIFLAQREGYPISDVAALQIMVGDLAGAAIALLAIIFLRRRMRLGPILCRLLVIETIVDFAVGTRQRIVEPRAGPTGVWWLILTFFAPLILVSIPMLIWQLYARRNEPLGDAKQPTRCLGRPVQEQVVH